MDNYYEIRINFQQFYFWFDFVKYSEIYKYHCFGDCLRFIWLWQNDHVSEVTQWIAITMTKLDFQDPWQHCEVRKGQICKKIHPKKSTINKSMMYFNRKLQSRLHFDPPRVRLSLCLLPSQTVWATAIIPSPSSIC